MELARGIEPPTGGLQNRCSAIELRQRASESTPGFGALASSARWRASRRRGLTG